jgi:hypothetical protein
LAESGTSLHRGACGVPADVRSANGFGSPKPAEQSAGFFCFSIFAFAPVQSISGIVYIIGGAMDHAMAWNLRICSEICTFPTLWKLAETRRGFARNESGCQRRYRTLVIGRKVASDFTTPQWTHFGHKYCPIILCCRLTLSVLVV